jgi:hypothetical protein
MRTIPSREGVFALGAAEGLDSTILDGLVVGTEHGLTTHGCARDVASAQDAQTCASKKCIGSVSPSPSSLRPPAPPCLYPWAKAQLARLAMTSLVGCDTPAIWSGIRIAFGDTDRRQLGGVGTERRVWRGLSAETGEITCGVPLTAASLLLGGRSGREGACTSSTSLLS